MSSKAEITRVEPREHVLLRPDMYIGSIHAETVTTWLWSRGKGVYQDEMQLVPGLYKIYDEIIVNASDNKQRDPERARGNKMTYIKVWCDTKTGRITVMNDGVESLIKYNAKEKMYTPELAFGVLMTSSNYDDSEERVTGGRNGYGSKLTNIYSKEFEVTVVDGGKKYVQKWTDNMKAKTAPVITDCPKSAASSIRISFVPDYLRFGLQYGLDEAHANLIARRAIDVAGCNKSVSVYINDYKVPITCFEDYVRMFFRASNPALVERFEGGEPEAGSVKAKDAGAGAGADADDGADASSDGCAGSVATATTAARTGGGRRAKDWTSDYIVVSSPHERWDVALCYSGSGDFQQLSFVNSINTIEGGSHVELVLDYLVKPIQEAVAKSLGANAKHAKPLTRAQIKNNTFLFIRSLVVNPSFDSQTKVCLRTAKGQLAQDLSAQCFDAAKFAKQAAKIEPFLTALQGIAYSQATKALSKTDGTKRAQLFNIPKLDDAIAAGTRDSAKCTLILTEGDSAKSLAVEGVSVLKDGREHYGIFPLRGKVINVRNETIEKVAANAEISNLKKILGLKQGMDYTDPATHKTLRYGRVLLMTDQDQDGSHIKGLLINLFDSYWVSLARRLGFLQAFLTPIVRCRKGKDVVSFYTLPEYRTWVEGQVSIKGWDIRYYKGLGSSTRAEAREYFKALDKMMKNFQYDARAGDRLNLAFHRKLADARKDWLSKTDPLNTYLDSRPKTIRISDFVDKELVLYDILSNQRSIPSLLDGFKPGQRKIMYACFKRGLYTNAIKVVQLSGYVSEHAAYHHGEQSLNDTIVRLAQSFTGANNVPMLVPEGLFGTRPRGGKDSSAPRYIRTFLSAIVRFVFHEADDRIVDYLEDDGQRIEPLHYLPVIPLVLCNGAAGIGTGFSTTVPQFNPLDLIEALRVRIYGRSTRRERRALLPWYRGWRGQTTMDFNAKNQFVRWRFRGLFELDDENRNALWITELPVGVWTEDYREELEKWLEGNTDDGAKAKAGGAKGAAKTSAAKAGAGTGTGTGAAAKALKEESKSGFVNGHPVLTAVNDYSDNDAVRIQVVLSEPAARALLHSDRAETEGTAEFEAIVKLFRLEDTLCHTNMWLHNENGVLEMYRTPSAIIDKFFQVRMEAYGRRKDSLVRDLAEKNLVASEKARFIKLIIEKQLAVSNVSRDKVVDLLWDTHRFHPERKNRLVLLAGGSLTDKGRAVERDRDHDRESAAGGLGGPGGLGGASGAAEAPPDNPDDDANVYLVNKALEGTVPDKTGPAFFAAVPKPILADLVRGYEYLLNMAISSLTKERYAALLLEAETAARALEELRSTPTVRLWLRDLARLELALGKFADNLQRLEYGRKITVSERDAEARFQEVEAAFLASDSGYGDKTGESDAEVAYVDLKDAEGRRIKKEAVSLPGLKQEKPATAKKESAGKRGGRKVKKEASEDEAASETSSDGGSGSGAAEPVVKAKPKAAAKSAAKATAKATASASASASTTPAATTSKVPALLAKRGDASAAIKALKSGAAKKRPLQISDESSYSSDGPDLDDYSTDESGSSALEDDL